MSNYILKLIIIILLLGVVPPNLYTRLNDTFEVNCYVHGIDGVLNFYDGDSLVDDNLIKV
jgi:hypothetical protein